MAETKDNQYYTFRENPFEHCKMLYAEFKPYNEEMCERVSENRKFYNGQDAELEKRRNDPKVKRSCVFVHAQRPAIDTCLSAIMDGLEEGYNDTIQLIPKADQEHDAVMEREEELNEAMRTDGILTGKIMTAARECRIAPVVFIKVGWDQELGIIHELKKGVIERGRKAVGWVRYAILGADDYPPEDRIAHHWDVKREGPYTEVKDFDEIYYDPEAHDHQDGRAMIEVCAYSWDELVAEANKRGWDKAVLGRMKLDKAQKSTAGGVGKDSVADKEREAQKINAGREYDAHKFAIAEFWIPVWDETGRKRIYNFVIGEKDYQLTPGMGTPTFFTQFPFVAVRHRKRTNQIEGTPAVELTKPLQRLNNDLNNAVNDVISFGIFKIRVSKSNNFTEQPNVRPGAIWYVTDINQLTELDVDMSPLMPLISLISLTERKIAQMHNAPDFGQGTNIDVPDEKVYQTKLRMMGSERRSRMDYKEIGEVLIEIAKWFIELYRMNDKPEWIFEANVDVPALTSNYTPQEEQQKRVMLVEMAMKAQSLYGTPLGRKKLRNLFKEMIQSVRVGDVKDFVLSDQEMSSEDPILQMVEALQTQQQGQQEGGNNNQPGGPGMLSGDSGQKQGVANASV